MDTFLFHKSIFFGNLIWDILCFYGPLFPCWVLFFQSLKFHDCQPVSNPSTHACVGCRCFHFAVSHFALWNIFSMNNTRFSKTFRLCCCNFWWDWNDSPKMFTWWCSALFHPMFQMDHACNFCNRSIFCNIVEWYGAFDWKIIKMSSVPWDFHHICRAIALTSIDLHAHT